MSAAFALVAFNTLIESNDRCTDRCKKAICGVDDVVSTTVLIQNSQIYDLIKNVNSITWYDKIASPAVTCAPASSQILNVIGIDI